MESYKVKLYENCCGKWTDVTKCLSYLDVLKYWNNRTNNGKIHSNITHGDYFRIVRC